MLTNLRSNSTQPLDNLTGPVRYGLTNDYMFRAVFQNSEEALRHLLSALLDIPYEDILSCEIRNPIVLGETIDDKTCVLCVDEDKNIQVTYNEVNEALDFFASVGQVSESEKRCCNYQTGKIY